MKAQYGHFLLAAIGGSGLLGGAAMPMDHDHSGSFSPMHCNMNLDSAQCVPFSSLNVDSTQKVTIDCGTCVIMDATGELALEGGLDVIGKLVFPSSRSALTIATPFVFVQGAFVVEPLPTKAAPQPDSLLEIKMVGTNDVYFTPHHNQTFDKCNGGGCNQSKKPFIVAGGYVDIQGLDDSCHTWSRLQSVSDAGTPVLTSTESAPQPLQGCSPKLIDESFDVHPGEDDLLLYFLLLNHHFCLDLINNSICLGHSPLSIKQSLDGMESTASPPLQMECSLCLTPHHHEFISRSNALPPTHTTS